MAVIPGRREQTDLSVREGILSALEQLVPTTKVEIRDVRNS